MAAADGVDGSTGCAAGRSAAAGDSEANDAVAVGTVWLQELNHPVVVAAHHPQGSESGFVVRQRCVVCAVGETRRRDEVLGSLAFDAELMQPVIGQPGDDGGWGWNRRVGRGGESGGDPNSGVAGQHEEGSEACCEVDVSRGQG